MGELWLLISLKSSLSNQVDMQTSWEKTHETGWEKYMFKQYTDPIVNIPG